MANAFFCEKCKRVRKDTDFYRSNNLEKYPNSGYLTICKQCLTMHVDNWDPSTFLWILEDIDVPYVPEEWNKLLAAYGKDPSKVSGTTILGRYLSKMKLKQFKNYRWKDGEFLKELNNKRIRDTMANSGYDENEIERTIAELNVDFPDLSRPQSRPVLDNSLDYQQIAASFSTTPTRPFAPGAIDDDEEDELVAQLTDEDKIYLRLKWGKAYKPEEWISLEKLYNDMTASYDIQGAGHIDTLKMLCKTSLKANQLLDIGDIDAFQKMSKVYDTLMRSGKFTAAQNKAERGEAVDSIGELVAMCEKEGFIPRFYVDTPQDKVDRTIQDLQNYTRTLITEEMGLGNLIENAIQQINTQNANVVNYGAEAADDEELFEQQLFNDSVPSQLTTEDYTELQNLENGFEEADDEYLRSLLEDGEI